MTILARDHIKAGEPIYHGYARSFNTTTMRRVMLFSGKHFGCECVRCTDPTEMGSYCSALLCQAGHSFFFCAFWPIIIVYPELGTKNYPMAVKQCCRRLTKKCMHERETDPKFSSVSLVHSLFD